MCRARLLREGGKEKIKRGVKMQRMMKALRKDGDKEVFSGRCSVPMRAPQFAWRVDRAAATQTLHNSHRGLAKSPGQSIRLNSPPFARKSPIEVKVLPPMVRIVPDAPSKESNEDKYFNTSLGFSPFASIALASKCTASYA